MENRNKQWGQAPSSSESNDQWKRHDGQYGGYHRQWGELHGQHSQNQQWYTSTGSTQNRHMHWNGHPQNQQGEPSWQMNQYPGVANGAQVPPGGFHYPPVDHQSNRVIQIFACSFLPHTTYRPISEKCGHLTILVLGPHMLLRVKRWWTGTSRWIRCSWKN